ncbi:polynucleotide kinase [Rhodococcus phage Trogglehumper]|uniref:Polynucleotide kinase n=1 Tax=Rhodococcus phage Trogglehumper TaxID=3038381 RepID=A0AAF0K1Y3_9CAUD|nr:polynucleotide kinase [Rhodococcus phage Trogglehumper]
MKKPPAIIVDVDGTLVDVRSTRRHVLGPKKDFDAFHSEAINCPPIPEVVEMCIDWHERGHGILVVTARKYRWFTDTENWLIEHLPVPYEGPFMRGDDDNRPDYEIKREIFGLLANRFEICHAIDDNPKVIALWEELGLNVHVVPGWDDAVSAAYVELANREGN